MSKAYFSSKILEAEFESCISELSGQDSTQKKVPKASTLYAQYEADDLWYPCSIIRHYKDGETCLVKFKDYENFQTCKCSSLRDENYNWPEPIADDQLPLVEMELISEAEANKNAPPLENLMQDFKEIDTPPQSSDEDEICEDSIGDRFDLESDRAENGKTGPKMVPRFIFNSEATISRNESLEIKSKYSQKSRLKLEDEEGNGKRELADGHTILKNSKLPIPPFPKFTTPSSDVELKSLLAAYYTAGYYAGRYESRNDGPNKNE